MLSTLQQIFICNIPAYVFAALAMWRKFNSGHYYEGVVFLLIMGDLVGMAYYLAMMLTPETASDSNMFLLSVFAAFIIPFLYMYHAPAGGQSRFSIAIVVLFLLAGVVFIPAASIELVPSYAVRYHTLPMQEMGVSVFYRGIYLTHLYWVSIVLLLQAVIAFVQVYKTVRFVHSHGAHYSPVAQALLAWDFNCGFLLATFFFIPLTFWQQPTMRLVIMITSSIIISVGNLLVFFGFDLNPVSDEDGQRTSLKEFVKENGELISRLRYLLEEEQVYLERGIQAETVIRRLGTNHVYFDRIMLSIYGVSFPEYVHRQRIKYAQTLLEATKQPDLDAIAQRCGYEDTNVFLRLYHRITGESL